MSACTGATSDMVLDAAGSNGPFQPLVLVHFRGEPGNMSSVCVCQKGDKRDLLI